MLPRFMQSLLIGRNLEMYSPVTAPVPQSKIINAKVDRVLSWRSIELALHKQEILAVVSAICVTIIA